MIQCFQKIDLQGALQEILGAMGRFFFFCMPINLSICAVKEENAFILNIAQGTMHFCHCSKEHFEPLTYLGGKGREGSGVST